MKSKKMNILVLYEDEVQELATFAQKIKASAGSEYTVKIRPVSEMAISELLAAQVLLLGVQDIKSPYWQEFKRLMNGINLAGRSAGYFLLKNAHELVQVLAPTDITLKQENFTDPASVAVWLKTVKPFTA
ncbi:MAG TPA: hypothetical protein P5519_06840 [Spirochaetia bacterium]|nr:hypothetical protein [Spirochaetales bacterium]HRS65588.1 hypothetical protein [Spirochaetia bacterium]HOT59897.1 hypothetical protein [Spirochaetales bacterium]HPD80884.1 hypothetical protein [Spirochaetales bacterium]HQK33547.1 hypothetical protein [Spirochaetales bacterium]